MRIVKPMIIASKKIIISHNSVFIPLVADNVELLFAISGIKSRVVANNKLYLAETIHKSIVSAKYNTFSKIFEKFKDWIPPSVFFQKN
jgi:hypothetical protein